MLKPSRADPGEFKTLNNKRLTIIGSEMHCGEGFAERLTVRVLSTQEVPAPHGDVSVLFLNRPLKGGIDAPGGVDEMDRATVRGFVAMLRSFPENQVAFGRLRKFIKQVHKCVARAGRRGGGAPCRRTRAAARKPPCAYAAAYRRGCACRLQRATDRAAACALRLGCVLPPACDHPRSFARNGELGSVAPSVRSCVQSQCDAAAKMMFKSGCFNSSADNPSRHLHFTHLRQVMESYVMEALHEPIFRWLATWHTEQTAALGRQLSSMMAVTQAGMHIKTHFQTDFSAACDKLGELGR